MILDSIYNEGKLQEIYKNVLTNMRCGVIIMTSKEKRENKTFFIYMGTLVFLLIVKIQIL